MVINVPEIYVDRVREWNEDRGLLDRPFNVENETRMLLSELDEYICALEENDVHEQIDAILDINVVLIGSILKSKHQNIDIVNEFNDFTYWENLLNASFDKIRKIGYEPKCCFNECLLEIESRVGSINIETGKFEKDKSKEAQSKWYKANYELCRLKEA